MAKTVLYVRVYVGNTKLCHPCWPIAVLKNSRINLDWYRTHKPLLKVSPEMAWRRGSSVTEAYSVFAHELWTAYGIRISNHTSNFSFQSFFLLFFPQNFLYQSRFKRQWCAEVEGKRVTFFRDFILWPLRFGSLLSWNPHDLTSISFHIETLFDSLQLYI